MNPFQKFTQRLINKNIRPNGRSPLQQRQQTISFLPSRGHLIFKKGETHVQIKISAQLTAPKNQRPTQGQVYFRVDCSSCSGSLQQNRKLSMECTKLLQTVIVGSKALDPESLCVSAGHYAWRIKSQAIVIKDDGNIIDCVMNGVIIGLMDCRKPLVAFSKSQLQIKNEVLQSLSLAHIPLSWTFMLTQNNLILDASSIEQSCQQSRITVSMNVYKQLCGLHKPGGVGVTQKILGGCIKLGEQKVKQKTQWIRNIVLKRQQLITL